MLYDFFNSPTALFWAAFIFLIDFPMRAGANLYKTRLPVVCAPARQSEKKNASKAERLHNMPCYRAALQVLLPGAEEL
jgi:hypothetical protein